MILPALISNQLTPTASIIVADDDERTPMNSPDRFKCRQQIRQVVREIESQDVREIIDTIFSDLLRLLECLELGETHLRQVDAAEESFALLQIIHAEARKLIEFIKKEGLNCAAMNEDLIDTLDGITFAVNHDLQRVFESHQQEASSPQIARAVLGKLYRAHDVLTNCLQQSTISLAMVFDPELVGTKLFNNSNMRYRQSLQLCENLSALLQQIEACEKSSDELALVSLSTDIEKFRSESLEYLMYSDWPQFESFSERIRIASTSWLELEPVLHQFRCYVETLLGQVRMRAVLANVFPIQFGADSSGQTAGCVDSSIQFSSPTHLPDENASWDTFAVAV
jgi:hypothetical protein